MVSRQSVEKWGDMAKYGRLVAVILEVSDLEHSEALYRDAFGLDLQPGDNGVDDRWIGGRHAEISLPGEREADLWSTDRSVG
jgi:hypothetical protein